MRKYFIKYFTISAFILVSISNVIAQIDEDSLNTGIDSILNEQVSGNNYIKSASKYYQTEEEAPSSTTIITSDEIERYGYQSLDDILRAQRGFYTSYDRNYVYVGVRGFSRPSDYNNRILLLFDGHRLNDYYTDAVNLGTELGLNAHLFERVEIVRGPGSELYGTSAMFAIINIIPKKVNTPNAPNVYAQFGNFNTKSIGFNYGRVLNNGVRFSINGNYYDSKGENLYYNEFDSEENNFGLAVNKDYENYYGIITSISYRDIELFAGGTFRKKGVPTASFETDFNADEITFDDQQFAEAKIHHEFSYKNQLNIRTYFDHYNYRGKYLYDGYMNEDMNDALTIGTEAQFIYDIQSNNRATFGAEYRRTFHSFYKDWDAEAVYVEFEEPYTVYSFFIHDEYQPTNNLSLTLGIRRDENINRSHSINPRFGIVYSPFTSHNFKLIGGTAFRDANAYERYYSDSASSVKNNPNLRPEKIATLEFIWEWQLNKKVKSIASTFYNDITALISPVVDPHDSLIYNDNVGKIKAYGFEYEINANITNYLNGYIRYSYQHSHDVSNDKVLSNSPQHLVRTGCDFIIFNNISAAMEYQYESPRITLSGNETTPIHLVNLNVSTTNLFNKFKLSFLIRNLLNKTIENPGGFEHVQEKITQPVRNYLLTFSWGI